jgi:outer membrane protein assembly factor BamB
LVKDGGIISCYDARAGELRFQGRLPALGKYHASPVAGDGKVYAASRRGVIVVFKASDTLEVLARNDLREELSATPALVDSKIYVRTAQHMFAFGER